MRSLDDINKLMDFIKENPVNFTWINPKTEVKQSDIPESGNGRFAKEFIREGEIVVILGGLILTEDEYQQIRKRYPFVSGLLVFNDFKIHQVNFNSDYNGTLNHSCDPNVFLDGQILVRALKDIEIGEEIYLDYGTIADQDLVLFENCQCGAYNCRKYITCKDWLSPSFRAERELFFSHYIQEVIRDTPTSEMIEQLHSLKKIDRSMSPILSEEICGI